MAVASLVDQLQLGDHVCFTFDDDDARLNAVASFVSDGLAAGDKVAYFTDVRLPEAVRESFAVRGVVVDAALGSGQLEIHSACRPVLSDGGMSVDSVVEALAAAGELARQQGHPGLRVVGDMAWSLARTPGFEALARYEVAINRLFPAGRTAAMCLYDRRQFSPAQLHAIIAAHPGHTGPGWPTARQPLLRAYRTGEPPGLRFVGQVDQTNLESFRALLAMLASEAAEGRVVLDLSGLDFVDIAAGSALIRTCEDAPALQVVGCRPPLLRLLALIGTSRIGQWETRHGEMARRPQ